MANIVALYDIEAKLIKLTALHLLLTTSVVYL